MAPELIGNLIVLSLEMTASGVECLIERYDPERTANDFLRVSWNATKCPPGYDSVGGGVAFVWRSPKYVKRVYRARPDSLGGSEFSWRDRVQGEGLMLLVALPLGYVIATADDATPTPVVTKIFENAWWGRAYKPTFCG